MSLDLMEKRGIKLPPKEIDVSGLTDVKVIAIRLWHGTLNFQTINKKGNII